MVANPSDSQTFLVFGTPIILALGITLEVVITAKPRHRRTIDTKPGYARVGRGDASKHLDTYEERGRWPARKDRAIKAQPGRRRSSPQSGGLVKTGATGKTIAREIGRSVVAPYQKASIEGISLSARPTVRRSAVAKKAKAIAASKTRRSR
jgi:hypothetical protein